jgi:serine protease
MNPLIQIKNAAPVSSRPDHIYRTGIAILRFATMVTILISSAMAAASAPIPAGFSSEIVQVKFKEGTKVIHAAALLPQNLRNSVHSITRLFTLSEEEMDELRAMAEQFSGEPLPNLNLWFQITLKPGTNATKFLENLRSLDSVDIAEPAPLPAPPPATTPDFTGNQGYLGPATAGIDAIFSATIPGGNGSGIKIYDVEYSWNQTHEDLSKANGVLLLLNAGDSAVDPFNNNNHGTAVLGELIADNDTKGVTGISWGADIGLAPVKTANLGYNPANAILLAMADGSPGDVILIEQQFPVCGLSGPCTGPGGNCGPSEWVQSVFDAIQTTVAIGFVVVEAAGNGGVNLDQAACDTKFDRTMRDSGAIIVGAGGPPAGLDRQRLPFSSYGSRVDLQGWGDQVMTTGYGTFYRNPDDLTNPNFWYTNTFNGTSSASPIVAGAAVNLQGIALNQSGGPLTPFQIREILVETGSPQLGNTAEHIGPRPDLREAIVEIIASDLAITKTGSPDPATVGDNLTYTVTVTNNGPNTATSVTVTDNLPAETTFVSCSSTGGGVCGGSDNNRTVTFASLATGESETITFVANVNCSVADGTVINNTATVNSSTPDPDPNNNSATATTTASNPPPAITGATADPSVLWPPNHRMVDVTVDYNVTDNCPLPPNSCTLSVTSNEPVNGQGDGDTSPDWIVLDDHHVLLRAERAGNGNGRVYTITITCTDSGGNSSSEQVEVRVPHDRGRR